MSRIGKKPIAIPAGGTVTCENSVVTVKGAKGTLVREIDPAITCQINGAEINMICPETASGDIQAKHGLYRALLHNMVVGVSEGYTKSLKVNGVGWKVAKQGKKLVMNIGFSHPVEFEEPAGITLNCPNPQRDCSCGYRQNARRTDGCKHQKIQRTRTLPRLRYRLQRRSNRA